VHPDLALPARKPGALRSPMPRDALTLADAGSRRSPSSASRAAAEAATMCSASSPSTAPT
jgi:hypothetical protein